MESLFDIAAATLVYSIPFIAGQWSLRQELGKAITEADANSIPFIAGQWSLRTAGGGSAESRRAEFNPLHCGAVVASGRSLTGSGRSWARIQSPSLRGSGRFDRIRQELGKAITENSIPFIAGQWSLRAARSGGAGTGAGRIQSPSLRGSGRFDTHSRGVSDPVLFNPLHCGAVVASRVVDCQKPSWYQNSIPFIAGQWSLLTNST